MFKKSFIFLLLTVIISLFITGCGLLPEEEVREEPELIEPPEPSIATEIVERESIAEEISGLGRVAASQEAELYFNQSGRVSDIYVRRNEVVEEGQRLAQLDLDELEFEHQLALLDLEREKLRLQQQEQLVGSQISQLDWELEQLNYQQTKLQVEKMEETIEAATIDAPFDGRITSISMSATDEVREYEDVITVADPDELILYMRVSAEEQQDIVPGLEAEVQIDDNLWVEGEVIEVPSVTAEIAPGEPDRRIRIQLVNQEKIAEEHGIPVDEQLSYDSLIQARIIMQRKEDALVLPQSAVREYGDRTFVRVIDEDGIRREVDVELGLETGKRVEIVDGLEEGDEVIAR